MSMSEEAVTEIAHEIRDRINNINRTWLKGDPADLQPYFHPDMVIQPPGNAPRVHGRDACIGSYEAFSRVARIKRFEPRSAEIDVFGETAVATYRYRIVYTMEDTEYDETGGELLVFLVDDDGQWRVAWRTMLT